MEVHILKENLGRAIQTAIRFTATRTHMPILAYIKIQADDKGIYFLATNLETGLKLRVAGKVVKPGEVVVPAKILYDLTQHLPVGGVVLQVSAEGLRVMAGGVRARLQTEKAEDFPPFAMDQKMIGKLSVKLMREGLDKVGYAISTDEARPVLTGCLWRTKERELVATDGYRLSVVRKMEAWDLIKEQGDFLVPGKIMMQAMQGFEEYQTESCDLGLDAQAQQLLMVGQDMTVAVRLLAGDYPQYETIMPKESRIEVECGREGLLEAVRAAAIFARDSANIVRLSLENGVLKVSANAPLVGENVVELEVEEKKAGKIQIAFNSKYLIDFLTHSEKEKITLGLTEALRPGLFEESGNKVYEHVIMPVRVRE
jgi:DNA polymerase-3 subunit beta